MEQVTKKEHNWLGYLGLAFLAGIAVYSFFSGGLVVGIIALVLFGAVLVL
jgi:hypothetical protein